MPLRGTARLRCVCLLAVIHACFVIVLSGCDGIPAAAGDVGSDADLAPASASDDSLDTEFLTLEDDVESYGDYRIVTRSLTPSTWDFSVEPLDTSGSTGKPSPFRFVWDFGDGSEGYPGDSQQYTFPGGGFYTITVTAYDLKDRVAFTLTLDLEVPPVPNQAPIADAGDDANAFAGDTVCLDGSASTDVDSDTLSFSWRQIAGVPVNLVSDTDDESRVCFVAPDVSEESRLVFGLNVDDGEQTVEDSVSVDVFALIQPAGFVVADAGGDVTVTSGETVTLDGSASEPASDEAAMSWSWTQLSGTAVELSDADQAVATFAAPEVGGSAETLVFSLTVTEGESVASDEVQVTVEPALGGGGGGVVGGGAPPADLCPNDPLKTDPGTCGCGVPDDDSDSDGVEDCIDSCPSDADKTEPGTCGCGVADADSDSDGAEDCIDDCPADPGKTEPGVCGCGVADADLDGDGGVDCVDGCPSDPNKTAPGICGCGVPDDDSDSDGAADCVDSCPSDADKTEPGVCGCDVADDDSDADGVADCLDECPGFDDSVDENDNGIPDGCDAAELAVETSSLDFGVSTVQLNVEAWNAGGGTLSYTTSTNAAWLAVSPASGSSTGEHDTLTVSVDRSGLGEGDHEGEVYVTPSAGAVFTISVSMAVSTAAAPMTTASHTEGVAPLAVFFDAIDGGGIPAPSGGDHTARHYAWNFDDADAGNWAYGAHGSSRNLATGYVAAHVFKTPGSYNVTLVVTEPNGDKTTYQQQIDVKDPATESGWQTFYVSADGNDSHAGTQAQPFKTFGRAMSELGAKRRILFHRGDSFTASSKATITTTGPGIIGAYGNENDPRPVIVRSGSSDVFDLRAADWRIMDLELNGDNDTANGAGVDAGAAAHRESLLLNLHIHGFYMAAWNTYAPQPIVHDHIFIVDCEMNGQGNKGMFIGGSRLAILGNHMHDTASHILRPWHCVKGVISENTLRDPLSGNAAVIKLHNAKNVANLPDGRWVIIAGNRIRGKAAWNVTIGTQDSVSDETVRDVVVERNVFEPHPELQISCRINAQDVTFRNNVASYTGTSLTPSLVQVTRWGIEPDPTGARIFNNSVYRADSGSVKLLSSAWSDTLVYNNIVYASSGTPTVSGSSGVLADNLTQNPMWENPGSGDFHLKVGSAAIDHGRSVTVTDDFYGNPRPANGDGSGGAEFDIGACEYTP